MRFYESQRTQGILGFNLGALSREYYTCRGTAQVHREGLRNSQVYSVSQRRNDESAVKSHVFVAIFEHSRALIHPDIVQVVNPVEPWREISDYPSFLSFLLFFYFLSFFVSFGSHAKGKGIYLAWEEELISYLPRVFRNVI